MGSMMRWAVVFSLLGIDAVALADSKPAPKTRTFDFTYSFTVNDLKPGEKARIWVPVPSSSEDQDITILTKNLPGKIDTEPKYGNKIMYIEGRADKDGKIPVELAYRVVRREVVGDLKNKVEAPAKLADFLKPDSLVPNDGKFLDLIKDKKLPADQVEAAKMLYDLVNSHMTYSKKGDGWGRGDTIWACDSKRGNCTDFHSLFISLARSQNIPAKFEIGFPIPPKAGEGDVAGYHCWAKFRPKGLGWIPVDISEANKEPKMKDYYFGNLTADRVALSEGRDLTLAPKQDGKPINFFVYPYVEVDKKPYSRITPKFKYKDVSK